jgi:two-component system response regulator FlrC
MHKKKILIIDDDLEILDLISEMLKEAGYSVKTASTQEKALKRLNLELFSLIISDFKMLGMDGMDFLKEIKRLHPLIPFVFLTGFIELLNVRDALDTGADEVLTKPVKKDHLLTIVEELTTSFKELEEKGSQSDHSLDSNYKKVSIELIISGHMDKHDRYLRLSDKKYVIVAYKGDELDVKRIEFYKSKGVENLFVLSEDLRKELADNRKKTEHLKKNHKKVSNKEKLEFVAQANNILFDQIVHDGMTQQTVDDVKESIDISLDLITTTDLTKKLFESLSENNEILHAHSVGTSVVSAMIAKSLGILTEKSKSLFALGGFLHDVGKAKLDKKIYSTPPHRLSSEEKQLLRAHPQLGANVLKEAKIPEVIQAIVMQHHENVCGKGYPRGIGGSKICQGAKVVRVASDFCHLTIKNPIYRHMKASNAIIQMEKTDIDNYDKKVLNALREVYGMRPKF